MKNRDAKSRNAVVTELDTNLFVDAGAGSGKTSAMIARIMMLLIRGLADVREVVAITFTNEGAASLKSRIQHELERAALEGSYASRGGDYIMLLDEERERVHRALTFLPLAPFNTIHGFCVTLLQERPVEAGIDPRFEMNTEGNIIPTLTHAWKKFLFNAAEKNHSFLRYALERGIHLDNVEEMIRLRCANPDLEIYSEDCNELSPTEIKKRYLEVQKVVKELYARVDTLRNETNTKVGRDRLSCVESIYAACEASKSPDNQLQFLLREQKSLNWKKQSLRFFEERVTRIAEIRTRTQKQTNDAYHSRIAAFIEEFVAWFYPHKRRTSSLDFDDLLFFTRNLLKDNIEVREYFKGRFKYLCVDETQDTDPLQTEIVFFLAEDAGSTAQRWNEVTLRKGKLFLVGDPKQSIYKFRRADIQMYEEAKKIVRKQGGKLLNLESNFRSSAPIIDFVNGHFASSFQRLEQHRAQGIHPEYVPLTVGSSQTTKLPNHVYEIQTPLMGKAASRSEYYMQEAESVVSFIHWLVDSSGPHIVDASSGKNRPIVLKDIMVLMRSTTHYGVYDRSLEDAGIPHFQVGGKAFFDSEDVRGLVFALRAVDDPTNTVALFGALKSPVFGFSDQDVYDFVSSGRPLSLFSSEGKEPLPVNQALRFLRTLHRNKDFLRASGVVKEVFNQTGMCHVVLTEPNGLQKSAKYFRFLELVHDVERDQKLSFRGVVESVGRIMDMDDPQLANVTISPSGENAVKFSTIHRAKGLEAPVVILADGKSREYKRQPANIVLRDRGKIVIPFGSNGGFYSLERETLEALEEDRELCESERLRYVAATRARDILAICVPSPEEGQDTFFGKFASSSLNPIVKAFGKAGAQGIVEKKHKRTIDLLNTFLSAIKAREENWKNVRVSLEKNRSPFVGVHDAMDLDESLFQRGQKSKGKAFGRILHRIMENYITNKEFKIDTVLDQWMEEEEVRKSLRSDILQSFSELKKHPHVKEAMTSPQSYSEWEFFLQRENEILNGVIDLVYKTEGGSWRIVDFKTDDTSDNSRKKELDALYQKQLSLYAEAFEEVTGNKVHDSTIIYIEELSA